MKIELRIKSLRNKNQKTDCRIIFNSEKEFIDREIEIANTKEMNFDEAVVFFCRYIAAGCAYDRKRIGEKTLKTKKIIYIF